VPSGNTRAGQLARDEREQHQRGTVDPLQVLEEDRERLTLRVADQESRHPIKQPESRLLGVERR
jgi:hypothetical protein